jgi:hypothetical protein
VLRCVATLKSPTNLPTCKSSTLDTEKYSRGSTDLLQLGTSLPAEVDSQLPPYHSCEVCVHLDFYSCRVFSTKLQSASHWFELRPNSERVQNSRMFLSRALLRTPFLRSRFVVPPTTFRRNMGSVSAIDSAIFRSLFGTDEIRKVWNSSGPESYSWKFSDSVCRSSMIRRTSIDALMLRRLWPVLSHNAGSYLDILASRSPPW